MRFPKLEEKRAALKAIFGAAGPELNVMAVPADLFGDHPCATLNDRISTIKALNQEVEELTEVGRQARAAGHGESGIDDGGVGTAGSLGAAVMGAGYDRQARMHVEVPFEAATFDAGIFNAATFSGDYEDAQRVRREAASLGADQRYLYPSLMRQPVARDVSGIESFRQKSRDPATPADMIRDIDETTPKPETDTETELVQLALHQIATVETGVPNICLENSKFREFIEFDLRYAFNEAIDYHVRAQIVAANPPEGTEGDNILESIVHAAEKVASAGYSPRILAAAPQDLIALKLLRQPGTDDYVGASGESFLDGLTKVSVKGLILPMVLDPTALGTFYASPVEVKAFEEAAGGTNSATVRIEANGLFVVQRSDAAATVALPEVSA